MTARPPRREFVRGAAPRRPRIQHRAAEDGPQGRVERKPGRDQRAVAEATFINETMLLHVRSSSVVPPGPMPSLPPAGPMSFGRAAAPAELEPAVPCAESQAMTTWSPRRREPSSAAAAPPTFTLFSPALAPDPLALALRRTIV